LPLNVDVVEDRFADLGFEERESFVTLGEKEMLHEDEFPFADEILRYLGNFEIKLLNNIPRVKAVTLNTFHYRSENIRKIKEKFQCDVESMEGAAFFYVCLMEKIPFLQIRAVTYYVELRKVENWNMPLSINNLNTTIFEMLCSFTEIL